MKRTIKATLAITLALVMVVIMAAACGGGGPGGTGSLAPPPAVHVPVPAPVIVDPGVAEGEPELVQTRTEKLILTWAHSSPAMHYGNIGIIEPLVQAFYEATEGMVEIIVHPGRSLTSPATSADDLAIGAIDLVWMSPAWTPGLFPFGAYGELPNHFRTGLEGTQVWWDLLETNEHFAAEYSQFKIFNYYVLPASELWMVDRPVQTPEDMPGLIVRVPGSVPERIVNAAGGATFVVGMSEAYDNLDRGVVNSTVADPGAITTYNLWEVVNYGTVGLPLTAATHLMAISWDAWDKLNEFEQAAFDRLTGNGRGLAEASAIYFDDEAAHSLNEIRATGSVQLYEMTEADLVLWDIAFEPVVREYIDSLTARGLPAQEVHDALMAARNARR